MKAIQCHVSTTRRHDCFAADKPKHQQQQCKQKKYRQRVREGIALVLPLFSPRMAVDERTLRKVCLLTLVAALSGCASQGRPPPHISLDVPEVQAKPLPEPPKPVEVVEVPKVLPMAAQMKPLPEVDDAKPAPEPADETARVSRANAEARMAPTREGFVNAIQVWPFSDGALYQVYAAPGRVTVISLQPGEELVTVAAGDTVRWIVGDTSSGAGSDLRVNVLVKPIRSGLKTNLVITTSRRTYLIELTSTDKAWMGAACCARRRGSQSNMGCETLWLRWRRCVQHNRARFGLMKAWMHCNDGWTSTSRCPAFLHPSDNT